MPSTKSTSTADLLLEILEQLSLGTAAADQLARHLRRAHPFGGAARRASGLIETLVSEDLVAADEAEGGPATYRITANGLAALQSRGRFPDSAAVLFTDIVGSTEMIDQLGEEEAHARRLRHFRLLRAAVVTRGGREVKSLGDGLMVVFAEPAAAIDCAIAMQRAVAADADGLGLRVGIHAGELLRHDDDYFGGTVVVASRLCAQAQAGQIIISDGTIESGEAGDSDSESLGPLQLKGISEPVAASLIFWHRAASGTRSDRRALKRLLATAERA